MILLSVLLLTGGISFQGRDSSAARFPQAFSVDVSGSPATSNSVKSAIERAVYTEFLARPGATWNFSTPPTYPLPSGNERTYSFSVTAAGEGLAQSYGQVTVVVKNEPYVWKPEDFLWFCNKPENLRSPQAIYANTLREGESIRLLYHHICFNDQPLYMRATLANESNLAAKVVLIDGDSRPDINPAMAGLRAAMTYLPNWASHSAEVVTIPPQSFVVVALRRMVLGQVMSGLCSMKLLKGGPPALRFEADAVNDGGSDWRSQLAELGPSPWDVIPAKPLSQLFPKAPKVELASNLSYEKPSDNQDLTVSIGGKAATWRIGVEGIAKVGGGRRLNGNYGVIYTLNAHIINNSSLPGTLVVVYEAATNYTAGLFLVDGKEVVVRPLQKGARRQIFVLSAPPHSDRIHEIQSLPLSGCGYPANVIMYPKYGVVK